MPIQLVVFDLDGTLIDSSQDLGDAVNALLGELGAAPLSLPAITAMVGEGAAVLVRRALAAAGLPPETPGALQRFLAHYGERLTVHTRPYPGIPETLASLRAERRTLAVLTNKPQQATDTILDRLGLAGSFSHVIGGDTAAGRKPDPAGLRRIIEDAGAGAESTVMVGDSPIDFETARRAGTGICLARYGFGYRFETTAFNGDERLVDAAGDLPAAIRSFP